VICETIKQAICPQKGIATYRLISCDEKTGIQALERHQQRLSAAKGGYLRQEFEYVRHGTVGLIAGIDVASGNLLHYHLGPTRTEQDYLAFIEAQVADLDSDEKVIFMMDQLNTHKSASLVRWVAGQIGYTGPLGKKGKEGILKSQQSRMEFLQRADHDIRFLFTPKHCSWLNPIENWFGRLSKSALKNLSVSSLDGLTQQIKAYIDYYNECLAIPFNWKFDGFQIDRPLKSTI
jgi:transposase